VVKKPEIVDAFHYHQQLTQNLAWFKHYLLKKKLALPE